PCCALPRACRHALLPPFPPRRSSDLAYDEAFDYFIENAGMDDTDGDGINDVQTGPMKGGIIICAAGNSGGRIEYPAADSRTVAVTAMGAAYNLEPYSNRGTEADIMAPGGRSEERRVGKERRDVWSRR